MVTSKDILKMMWKLTIQTLALIFFISGLGLSELEGTSLSAAEFGQDHTFGVDMAVGFPQLIGLELTYLGSSYFHPGFGFGSLPINSLLNKEIKLAPLAANLSLPDSYSLVPSASYNLYSAFFYLKYFPSGHSGFFIDLMASSFTFNGSINADLKNLATGGTLRSVITGSASLTQWMIGLAFGYQLRLGSMLFFEGAAGAGYLLPPSYAVSLGGTAASTIGIIPNGEAEFTALKSQIQTAYDSAIATYRSSVKFLPYTFINFGINF